MAFVISAVFVATTKSTKQELKQLSLKQINDIFKNFDLSLAPARELQISEPFKQFSLLKHVDFVVCDENMRVKVIVELDDSSHNNKARKERDSFVDLILISVGYKIIHTKYITDKLLDTIWNAGEEQ